MSAPSTFDFSGRTFIVTGGTRGIGYAYSDALAKAHARVAIIYRTRKDDAEKAAKELSEKHGVSVMAFQCDTVNAEQTVRMFADIDKRLGPVTGVIANSAGVSVMKRAEELTNEDFKYVYDVNVLGVFNSARAAQKLWQGREPKNFSIVVTSSISSKIINQAATNEPLRQAFYNSSKAAVSHLARALAAEWAREKIRVNVVSPGYVDTDQTRGIDKNILEHQKKNIPMGHFARPEQITGQALLLLSEHASYMTGGEYFVDGGELLW